MPVRTLDRVDDNITTGLGSLGFAFGPGTIAAIVRRASDSGVAETIFKAGVSAVSAQYLLSLSSTGRLQLQVGSTVQSLSGFNVLTADGWVLIAASKASGTVAARLHKYVFNTATWTHDNAANTAANSGVAATSARIGSTQSPAVFFGGDIGILGVANTVLNDSAIEALTSGEAAWDSAGFVAKWMLDQASTATPVDDDIGAADQSAITGTSVTATNIPWVPLIKEGSGNVAGISSLSGSASLTSPGHGAVSGAGSLSGGARKTNGGAGAVSGSSSLAGTSGVTHAGTSSLNGSSGLAGSSSSTSVGGGSTSGTSSITGGAGVTLHGLAPVEAQAGLSGTAEVLVLQVGSGLLSGSSSLSGASVRGLGGYGALNNTCTLMGSGTVTFVGSGGLFGEGELVGSGTGGVRSINTVTGWISDSRTGLISVPATGSVS